MPSAVSDLYVRRVSFVKRGAVRDPSNPSEPRRRLLWKSEDGEETNGGASAPTNNAPKGETMPATTEELQEALAKAEKERDEALRKAQDAEEALAKSSKKKTDNTDTDTDGDGDGDGTEAMNKAELPAPVREALEKAEREAEQLRKEAKEAQEIAKAERDQRVTREFIAKAEEYKALSVAPAEFGPLLKAANEKLSESEYAELERVLKSADEQITKGDLFKEAGRGGVPRRSGDGDAYQKALSKAQELRKADSSLSEVAAMEKAMADPDVVEAYEREMSR